MTAAKNINIVAPNIFESHDYREFLKDWFVYLKNYKGLSIRKLSVKAKLAVGYLPMVLSGKRPLTEKVLLSLRPHLNIKDREFEFLRCLRDLNEANQQEDMLTAYNKITRFSQYKKQNNKALEAHKLLSAWYYTAILEMAKFNDFKLDAKYIQKNLKKKVPLKQIKAALEFLLASGFLTISTDGKARVADKSIECHDGIFRISMGAFHGQMLDLATESIHNTER